MNSKEGSKILVNIAILNQTVYSDNYLHPIYIHICSSIIDGDSRHHHNSNYVARATILHQVRCKLSIIQNLIVEEDLMFTRKEHSFFNDPYFKIVREEQHYIEVQSVNTGHCWNMLLNQLQLLLKMSVFRNTYWLIKLLGR